MGPFVWVAAAPSVGGSVSRMSSRARYVIGGLVLVTAAVIVGVGMSGPERNDGPSAARSTHQLEHVVLYSANAGFAVCTRAPLHNCTITHTSAPTGQRYTVRIGPVNVSPVQTCDGMVGRALEECGAVPETRPISPTWLRCAGAHGFFGGAPTVAVDPRDEEPGLRIGEAVLRCDEGAMAAVFEAP